MADLPLSFKELIEQTVAQQVAEQLQSMSTQTQSISTQAYELKERMGLLETSLGYFQDSIQTTRDITLTAMNLQPTPSTNFSPPSISPTRSPYLIASCYYEACLRYWTACQTVYVLSTQVNNVSAHIAREVNMATWQMANAGIDTRREWFDLMDSLTEDIVLDISRVAASTQILSITFLFVDGLMVTGAMTPFDRINLGGLEPGTIVYINDEMYVVGNENRICIAAFYDEGYEVFANNYNSNR